MSLLPVSRAACALPVVAVLACARATPAPTTTVTPAPVIVTSPGGDRSAAVRGLPAVPEIDGPLAVKVVYPSTNQIITSRDSNFVFGSVGSGRASLTVNAVPARVYPNGAFMIYLANPPAAAQRYDLVAARGVDTARTTLTIRLASAIVHPPVVEPPARMPDNLPTPRADTIASLNSRIDSLRSQLARNDPIGVVELGHPLAGGDSDITVVGRPQVAGTYKWFFTPGTIVPLVARAAGAARIRLDSELDVFVDSADVRDVAPGTVVPRHVTSNIRVRGSSMGVDVVIPIGAPAPWFVEEGDRSITLTLYGVRGNTDLVNYATSDSMVKTVEWSQVSSDRARVTVNLRAAPYGYLVLWENNALVLKIRGRPAIDPDHPLAGLVIAVDPGHPPIGATGPTGLWEPQATLPVGVRLERILEERGARVVMTRTTDSAIALGDRPIIARRANANAFVSIHYNALPDGVNPFLNPGTGTYFFRTHSEPLAREVQRGMVAQLGLADLGVNYDNLAVVRGTWYPAILCEGAFIMMPDQEAAMRTPGFQDRYALGIANGLENYFRGLAGR